MRKSTLVVLIVACVVLTIGTLILIRTSFGRSVMATIYEKVYFGLISRPKWTLVFQVQVQDAVNSYADSAMTCLDEDLRRSQISFAGIERNNPGSVEQAGSIAIQVKGIVPTSRANFTETVQRGKCTPLRVEPLDETTYRLTPSEEQVRALAGETLLQTREVLENRVNGLGLAARVRLTGDLLHPTNEIRVEFASNVKDRARVHQVLTQPQRLEITPVQDGPFTNREEAMTKYGGVLPGRTTVACNRQAPDSPSECFLLQPTPVITSRDLRSAHADRDEYGRWQTTFNLSADGAARFGRYTERNIGTRLAIVLDRELRSAPTIQNKITDSGLISNLKTKEEAEDFALMLRTGALPARLVTLEER